MGWGFLFVVFIQYLWAAYPPLLGDSLQCTNAKNTLEDYCTLVDAEARMRDIIDSANPETGNNAKSGIASNAFVWVRSLSRVQNDYIHFTNRCYKAIKDCSKTCGQKFPPTALPLGTSLKCYNPDRLSAKNYDKAGMAILQLCTLLETQVGSLKHITIEPNFQACDTFRRSGIVFPDLNANGGSTAGNLLNQYFSNQNDMIPSIIDPSSGDIPASVKVTSHNITESPNARAPASTNNLVLGLGQRHGSDLIGVANSDLFGQIEQRILLLGD